MVPALMKQQKATLTIIATNRAKTPFSVGEL